MIWPRPRPTRSETEDSPKDESSLVSESSSAHGLGDDPASELSPEPAESAFVPDRPIATSPPEQTTAPALAPQLPQSDTQFAPAVADEALALTETQWTLPGATDAVEVLDGYYAGRSQAGNVGPMLRISPSIRSRQFGAYVPDSVVDAGVVSDSVSIGVVSIKGASHHLKGDPRQDAYAIASDDSWVVIAIADGVSEARMSHLSAAEASRVAANESLRALAAAHDPADADWQAVGTKSRSAIRTLGQRLAQQQAGSGSAQPDVSDRLIAGILATTCDVLAVPARRIDGLLRAWRVRIAGDGSFYVIDPNRGGPLSTVGRIRPRRSSVTP